MAKRLADLPNHRPQLNLLIMCACGCGEVCNESGDWVTVEGEHFADEKHWARLYEAKIGDDTVTYWDGETVDYDDWREGVVSHG